MVACVCRVAAGAEGDASFVVVAELAAGARYGRRGSGAGGMRHATCDMQHATERAPTAAGKDGARNNRRSMGSNGLGGLVFLTSTRMR